MITGSNDHKFVKTGVANETGCIREEGRGGGGRRNYLLEMGPQLLTFQIAMKGIAAGAATKDAAQPNHLMVSVKGGRGVDPSFDDVHGQVETSCLGESRSIC